VLPETRLGLVPALVSVVVRRRVGDGTLKRMALGGISLDAERAVEHGLADFLAEGSASETADEFARELLRDHAPGALARTKRFLSRRAGAGLEAELSEARREFEDAVGSDEARRGLDAFRRKESVRWDGA
jgi:methylglutaconyl-CoA hydratase